MVRAFGHCSLVVMMALTFVPSMPALPMYAASPQSVQYSHLRMPRGMRKSTNTGSKMKSAKKMSDIIFPKSF